MTNQFAGDTKRSSQRLRQPLRFDDIHNDDIYKTQGQVSLCETWP